MTRITLLSGLAPYDDPWHPFAETTERVAAVLRPLGSVQIRGDVDAALAGLSDPAATPDLLVINIGNPGDDSPPPEARAGLLTAARAGMPLLALHSSATTFPQWPQWESLIGGRWVRATTFHPDASRATIELTTEGRAMTGSGERFETVDERYTALALQEDAVPLAVHEHDGARHPLAWRFERDGVRAAFDGLGHDASAYDAAGARALLYGCAAWLLGLDRTPADGTDQAPDA